jgi:hypothetical protein
MTEQYHFVQHFLNPCGYVKTVFTCTAPVGAKCRMHCKTCYGNGLEACGCEYREPPREPDMQDFGSCLIVDWLNDDAPEESYNGERTPVRGPEPQAIQEEWNGDNYGWDYAPDPEPPRQTEPELLHIVSSWRNHSGSVQVKVVEHFFPRPSRFVGPRLFTFEMAGVCNNRANIDVFGQVYEMVKDEVTHHGWTLTVRPVQ